MLCVSKCSAPSRGPGKLDASNSNRIVSVRFCPLACRTRTPTGAMLSICVEPPFSWARFWLWRNFCSGVGLVNQFRTVQKWFPNLWLFSGPKNGRTKRAPIMDAQLVLSKVGPKYDPTFWVPTQKKLDQRLKCSSLAIYSTFQGCLPVTGLTPASTKDSVNQRLGGACNSIDSQPTGGYRI